MYVSSPVYLRVELVKEPAQMILAVEVVSICATLVPMIRAKRRCLARPKNGPDGLLEGASPSDTVTAV
jgi:hypothetical protein